MKYLRLTIFLLILSISGVKSFAVTNPAFTYSFFQMKNNPAELAFPIKSIFYLSPSQQNSGTILGLKTEKFQIQHTQYSNSDSWYIASAVVLHKTLTLGAGYDTQTQMLNSGIIFRPFRRLSFGSEVIYNNTKKNLNLAIALQPTSRRLTIGYGRIGELESSSFTNTSNHYFLEAEPVDGWIFGARYDESMKEFNFSLGFNLSHFSLSTQGKADNMQVSAAYYSNFLATTPKGKVIHTLTLEGDYQREYLGHVFQKNNFYDLIQTLRVFRDSYKTAGLVLDVKQFSMGLSELLELFDVLKSIKDAGKKIYMYSVGGTTAHFLLGSVADKQYMNPVGSYLIRGMGSSRLYWGALLDSVGITPEIERIGKYKTSPENVLSDKMSDEAKKQLQRYLGQIQTLLIQLMAEERKLSEDSVKTIISSGPYTLEDALENNLIDKLIYPDELKSEIQKYEKAKRIDFKTIYELSPSQGFQSEWRFAQPSSNIAVIYCSGAIYEGKSGPSGLGGNMNMGAETIKARLRMAAKDPFIKAIVLRIDSPGGSTLASDIIWREIQKINKPKDKKRQKPIIVSMGNYAASGGYYIVANTDYIFAEKATLTGSIGIYGGPISFEKLIQKLHLNADYVVTDENALFGNPYFNATERERIFNRKSIAEFYERFISNVAKGRHLNKEKVDSLGQGRVWTGEQALEIGLIDELGSLDDAINKAAQMGNVREIHIQNYENYPIPGYKITSFSSSLMYKMLLKNHPALQSLEKELNLLIRSDEDALLLYPFTINTLMFDK